MPNERMRSQYILRGEKDRQGLKDLVSLTFRFYGEEEIKNEIL